MVGDLWSFDTSFVLHILSQSFSAPHIFSVETHFVDLAAAGLLGLSEF